MDLKDIISMLDKKYQVDPVGCPNEGKFVKFQTGQTNSVHGNLTVHGSGAFLICGMCGHNSPIGRP